MAKWRERKREGTYFKQISLFRTRCIYVAGRTDAVCICTARLDAPRRDLPFFSLRGEVKKVSNLKGLKRFPRGWRVGLSALKHRSDRQSFFFSFLPFPFLTPQTLLSTVLFRFFSLFSPYSVVTYCELLTEPRRPRPAEKDSAVSLPMRKISCDMKNDADTLAMRLVLSCLDTCCRNRVVCRV